MKAEEYLIKKHIRLKVGIWRLPDILEDFAEIKTKELQEEIETIKNSITVAEFDELELELAEKEQVIEKMKKGLQDLVDAKQVKDSQGKTGLYMQKKEAAWKQAKELLK